MRTFHDILVAEQPKMPLAITKVTARGILLYIPQIGTIKCWLSNADSLSVVQSAAPVPRSKVAFKGDE